MKKFSHFKKVVESKEISQLSKSELKFITGGDLSLDAGGSKTSQSAATGTFTCCISTCYCLPCIPKLDPKKPK